jgi:hypothetical protein
MPLSDDAWKKHIGAFLTNKDPKQRDAYFNWALQFKPQDVEERKGPRGEMIYTPHDCDLPDAWETPLGSIWACHSHREWRLCYDQWILEGVGGAKRWVLFKRNMRG